MERERGIFDCRPILHTSDMTRSLGFYRDQLGFGIGWRWRDETAAFLRDEEDATPDTALVFRDSVQLILGTQGAPGTWLHLDVASADELALLHGEWRSRDAPISEPPSVRPWGMYEMRVVDPDGHVFRVSAPPR